jgi:hypothetical protein
MGRTVAGHLRRLARFGRQAGYELQKIIDVFGEWGARWAFGANQNSDWRRAYACRRRVGCPVRHRESVGEPATQCLGSAYRTRPKIGKKWNGFVRVDVGQRRTQAAREKPMKKLLMIAAAASLLVTAATAQTTVTTGVGSAAVQIEPEYRTKIKTYVTEKKLRPVTTQERIVVGAKVPASVELEAVPADWGPSVSKYRYVYSNDRVMLVDPGTRTVVHEID